ncbi:hypothetical protein BBOV_I001920 [Babesia bovis T2Bo]|uniref:Uncharacterized protein n=1 Tax=Babesia bovis TaxID=5865 RepID=A7AW48_BABBO|nr:hypothetical protein BBOV_I001920 [Babesia bovis T2Bo]EDO05276.1 hypothetical protein BBOV_I001920 [Babesia bovis T2Bo]|eukprot:XP_001608844.1 hypothetical protein [Babesia bovis T2Bo]
MLLKRRLSFRRSRFSCKKLAFLELQRYRWQEYGRWLTRRKRAERVYFLPSVKDEVDVLSSESVQRILHQGTAFHFSKDIVKSSPDSSHKSLFEGLINLRRIKQSDLVLLLSLLIKLGVSEYTLLSRTLLHCISRFENFTLSEVAQISFVIQDLPESFRNEFCRRWMPKLIRLLSRLVSNDRLPFDFGELAKLSFALSQFSPTSYSVISALLSHIPIHDGENDSHHSRDISLFCRSMLRSGFVNCEFLSYVSSFYTDTLTKALDRIITRTNQRSVLSRRNIVFALEDDHSDCFVPLDDLLLFLKTCERFGYHNRALLSVFISYVQSCMSYMVHDRYVAEYYRNYMTTPKDSVASKIRHILLSGKCKDVKSGRLNLQHIVKELNKNPSRSSWRFWSISSICTVGSKYITHRFEFAMFMEFVLSKLDLDGINQPETVALLELCHNFSNFSSRLVSYITPLSKRLSSLSATNDKDDDTIGMAHANTNLIGAPLTVSSLSKHCESYIKDGNDAALQSIIHTLSQMSLRLPDVYCWPCIWQMVNIAATKRCFEVLPILRSFIEESFLGIINLDDASEHACTVINHLLDDARPFAEFGLYLDSCLRLIELFTAASLSRDYGDLVCFGNFFHLCVTVGLWKSHKSLDADPDTVEAVQRLSSILEHYLVLFSETKRDKLSQEVPRRVTKRVLSSLKMHYGLGSDYNSNTIECCLGLLRSNDSAKSLGFIRSNVDLIRHIILQNSF